MKKVLYLLLFCPLFLSAQINESDTLKVKASLSVTGFWQRGNVQTSIFRARSDISVRPWKKWAFKNTNSYIYQAFGGEKADEDFLSLNFLSLHPDRRVFPLALAFFSTNFRRAIDSRYLLGAGATFQVLRKKYQWLKFSLTCEYEETNFNQTNFNNSEYDGSQSIETVRGTIWVGGKYHLFDKKLILSHESYFQPSLEQGNNSRWSADISVELPVWKHVNFKINYLETFESIVIESQVQTDQYLTVGLTVKSYE